MGAWREPTSSSERRGHSGDFELLANDRLGVLTATAAVLRTATHVTLDQAATRALAERWAREPWPQVSGLDSFHWNDGTERMVNFVLVLDALNFCFWGEPGQPRWRIGWQGQVLDGYNALAAALSRAVGDGCPIWDAGYLAAIGPEELAQVLRPIVGSAQIPLFETRLANAREVGRVLLERYHGQFATAVDSAHGSAVSLVSLLARDFPSFRDVAWREGYMVPFFKRAQICVADLHTAFGGEGYGAFDDLAELTAFADYKLPQLLRHLGILQYSTELAAQVDQLQLLEPGAEEEVEIRSATIWGVEWLRRELAGMGMEHPASAIDYRLWSDSQTKSGDTRPYHRTRTSYY